MLFTYGWGWYVGEMCLWPILGVEVRRCLNFYDEKIYSAWPGANRAEIGEMGHPGHDSGIYVDNAQCFKIFEILKNGGILSNLVCFVSECDIDQFDIWIDIVSRVLMLGESRSW